MAFSVQQMHQQFKDELDKVDSLAVPNYTATEIDRMLNEAQERFIKERLPESRTKATTVEMTQRRIDDLSALMRNYIATSAIFVTIPENKENGTFVPLPNIYKYSLDQGCNITYTDDCGNLVDGLVSPGLSKSNAKIFQCTHNQFSKLVEDPFHQPDKRDVLQLPFRDVDGSATLNEQPFKAIELVAGPGVTINSYIMRYLKEPRQIDLAANTTCELGETQAKEIVKMAVAEVLKIISDPRYQPQKGELSITE